MRGARTRLAGAVLAALLLGGASLSAGNPSPLEDVRVLAAEGRRAAARAALDSLLARPDSLSSADRRDAERLRVELEPDGERYEEGLRRLLAEEQEPGPRASLSLAVGHVLFARGKLEEARDFFHRARELGREEEGSLWEGLTDLALGAVSGAREALERAAGSGNRAIRERAFLALGEVHRLAGRCEDALGYYQAVREETHPEAGWWAAAVLREAQCRRKLGETARGRELLQLLLQRAPDSYEAALAEVSLAREPVPEGEGAVAPLPAPAAPDSTAVRYAVQVGAFSLAENAKTLAQRLADNGVAGVRVASETDGLHRVLVGDFSSRDRAESLGDSLGTAFGVGFRVVREKEN